MPTMTRTAELASIMRGSVMRLSRRLRFERTDTGLSLTQIATLGTLDRHGALTPRELAEHEKVRPPSMTRILAHLEDLGMILRTPHATDGRQHLVTLTASAKELLKADRRQREAWLAKRLAELTQEERDLLRAAAPVIEKLSRG
jgi:DNA-binding MarR family transcriptional regulator